MNILKHRQNLRALLKPVLLVALIIMNIVCSVVHKANGHINYNLYLYEVENFSKYKNDFDALANLFSERFKDDLSTDNNLSHVIIYPAEEEVVVTYIYKDNSKSKQLSESIDDSVQDSFKSVISAFSMHRENGFADIRVSRDQISFTVYGPYSIIRSNKRPEYVYDPDKEYYDSYYVDRIGISNWYQVIGKWGNYVP